MEQVDKSEYSISIAYRLAPFFSSSTYILATFIFSFFLSFSPISF